MKRNVTIALTVLMLTALTLPKAQAETQPEQILNRTQPDSTTVTKPTQPSSQLPNGEPDNLKGLSENSSATPDKLLPERDRLIQERFLIKITPS